MRESFHMLADEILTYIHEQAAGASVPVPCHWITGDADGFDFDAGTDWCRECAEYVVADFMAENPDLDDDVIRLDGGWGTDHDCAPWCELCGCKLDGSLTNYGSQEELDHFEVYPPTDAESWDALSLALQNVRDDAPCWTWIAEMVRAHARSALLSTMAAYARRGC